MRWQSVLDAIFPYIEPLSPAQEAAAAQSLQRDLAAIHAANWAGHEERALDEAQRVADAEMERVKTAETKATTYLAVLAALVPIILTLEGANWEKKVGPAPDVLRLSILAVATLFIAAAGYHAFKTLQVSGFQTIRELEVATAWQGTAPLPELTRNTLLAARGSRDAVNAKVTRIKVTHAHLLRAFLTFIVLLLLDPLFYLFGPAPHAASPPPPAIVKPAPFAAPPMANCPSPPIVKMPPARVIPLFQHHRHASATAKDKAGCEGPLPNGRDGGAALDTEAASLPTAVTQ